MEGIVIRNHAGCPYIVNAIFCTGTAPRDRNKIVIEVIVIPRSQEVSPINQARCTGRLVKCERVVVPMRIGRGGVVQAVNRASSVVNIVNKVIKNQIGLIGRRRRI